jgi:hypothetical protein
MSWALQNAKNRFSAVVEAALRQGPSVGRNGNEVGSVPDVV